MQVLAVAGTTVWFLLVALLWYARPGELAWFGGSAVLAIVFFTGFFWYVTQRR